MTRTLAQCVSGERVVVGSIRGLPARMMRLAALGVVPGAELRVQQMRPVVVVELDESVLAVERDVAACVQVSSL